MQVNEAAMVGTSGVVQVEVVTLERVAARRTNRDRFPGRDGCSGLQGTWRLCGRLFWAASGQLVGAACSSRRCVTLRHAVNAPESGRHHYRSVRFSTGL